MAAKRLERAEKVLTIRDVSNLLGLPEQDILALVDKGLLPHIKLEDGFLRFRKKDIIKAKVVIKDSYSQKEKVSHFFEAINDFFYFNNFYIFSAIIIITLLLITLQDFHF